MKNIKVVGVLSLSSMLLFSSCYVAKKYDRKDAVVSQHLYRDVNTNDSNSIAHISWKEFYTDEQLQAYLSLALDSNFDVRQAIENIKIYEANLKQAKAAYYPTLAVGPGVSYQTQSLNTQFGQIIGERRHIVQYDVTGTMSWEADLWGKLTAAKRSSRALYLMSQDMLRATQVNLIANIASMYYQLQALDEQKRITNISIENRRKSLQTTKALKIAGTVTEVAVQQSEALLLNAEAYILTLDNSIRIQENALCVLLGLEPQPIKRNALHDAATITKWSTGVPYLLLSNRPDVRAAEQQLISAFELTNVAKSAFYPSLRLTASGGFQSISIDQLFNLNSLFASVITSLTQPLWNKRQIRSQYEISLANRQRAYLQFRAALLNAGREVSNALYSYEAQGKLVNLKQHEFEAYQKATTYSQNLLNHGMANYLEVLTAQQNELNAQISAVNAHYERLNAMVQLYRALGGGWK